jgi:hypothetical protein
MNKLFKGFNPWVIIFVIMALFHIWRESWQDVAIFGISALVILTQVFGLTKVGFSAQPKLSLWTIAPVVALSAIVLYISPRHGLENFLVLIFFILVGIALIMYKDAARQYPAKITIRRSRLYWSLWAIGFALNELFAYVASKLTGSLEAFPTISVILDPVLDEPLGRAVFVALWLTAGIYLFGVRRKR